MRKRKHSTYPIPFERFCLNCGKQLKQRQDTFCSRSCSGSIAITKTVAVKNKGKGKSHIRVKLPCGKREYLHHLVYELGTGEPLKDGEIVHHIDGNKHNNDFSNLEKLSGRAAHLHVHNYHKKTKPETTEEFEKIEGYYF